MTLATTLPPRTAPPRRSFYGDQFSPTTDAQTRVNASTFQVFKACPRKYYYTVLLSQGKSAADPDLRFGGLLHAAKAVYATLLRTFVWYADQYANDAVETLRLPSGRPAVEVGFEFDSGVAGLGGEQITFVGTLDRIGRFNGATYVCDTKTSSSARWVTAQNYTPNGQFSLYVAAAAVCFGIEAEGLILDGVVVGPNATEFHRTIVPRPQGVIEEWLADARVHLRHLTEAFARDEWPQNDAACGLYGGCRFRSVCGANPAHRDALLAQLNGPRSLAP